MTIAYFSLQPQEMPGYWASEGSNAYLQGIAEIRSDAKNCSSRSKSCGESCIPRDYKCRLSSKALQKIVSQRENQIRDLPIEHATVFDGESGQPLVNKSGDDTSIYFSNAEIRRMKGGIFTHNHPNLGWGDDDPRSKGLGFSPDDIEFAQIAQLKEMRAVTTNYDHSVKPGRGGWGTQAQIKDTYKKHSTQVYMRSLTDIRKGSSLAQIEADYHHKVMEGVSSELGWSYSRKEVARASIRRDFVGNLNCGPGTKACKGVCIPRDYNCKPRDRAEGVAKSVVNKGIAKLGETKKHLSDEQVERVEQIEARIVELAGKNLRRKAEIKRKIRDINKEKKR